jgi:hypothetical protein
MGISAAASVLIIKYLRPLRRLRLRGRRRRVLLLAAAVVPGPPKKQINRCVCAHS